MCDEHVSMPRITRKNQKVGASNDARDPFVVTRRAHLCLTAHRAHKMRPVIAGDASMDHPTRKEHNNVVIMANGALVPEM